MIGAGMRRCGLGLAGTLVAFAAQALTAQELQALLQSAPVRSTAFQETRESPWLAAPVESRGTMESGPQGLEKRVVTPRQETWRLLADRMEWDGPDGVATKRILYTEAPAVAVLAHAIRRVVAADLAALANDFRITVAGDEKLWTVRLQPIDQTVARQLDRLELQGAGPRLQAIVVVERDGQRTTTRLLP